ncbi:hypothetical protein ACXX9E_29045 [Pseudomonas sp. GNP014]
MDYGCIWLGFKGKLIKPFSFSILIGDMIGGGGGVEGGGIFGLITKVVNWVKQLFSDPAA